MATFDLSNVSKVEKFPTHFIAHLKNGTTLPIPKEGLSPEHVQEIERFADGDMATEEPVVDEAPAPIVPPVVPPVVGPTAGGGAPLTSQVGPVAPAPVDGVPALSSAPVIPPGAAVPSLQATMEAQGSGAQAIPATTPEQQRIYDEYLAKGGSEADARAAAGIGQTPGTPAAAAPAGLPTEQAGPPALSPQERMQADIDAKIKKLMGTTPGGGATGADEISKAFREQNAALQNEALANATYYRQKAQLDADTSRQISEANKAYALDRAHNDAVGNALAEAIRTSKIDPNRIFNDPQTGGANTMLATFGAAIGAFGATLGHTQNFAQEIINKTIDNDIKGQEANLGKQQSMLSYYLSKGRDMDAAYALTKANLLDAAAGQALQLADRLGQSKAADDAKFQAGGLRAQAAQIRSSLQTAGMQRAALGAQLNAQKLQQLFTQRWMLSMSGDAGALDPQEAGIMMGGPEAYGKHAINVTRPHPDETGTYRPGVYTHYQGLLTDPSLRQKATEEYRTQREQSDRLIQLERLYALANNRPLSPDERALAHREAAEWAQGQAHANIDTTRFSPLEHKLSDELVADPDNWLDVTFPSRAVAKLKAARDMQMKMFDSLDDAYLTRNFRKRS